MLYSITLQSGHQIDAKALMVSATYSGLAEGLPSKATNLGILNSAQPNAKRAFGFFPCHIIEPDLKPVQYGGRTYYILPKVMFNALFQTYETTHEADAIGSALIVIWFQQNFQAHPSDPIAAELKALDWTTEAQDFDL